MTRNLYDELSISKDGIFTEDFLKDIDSLVSQYGLEWETLTPEGLLSLLYFVEAHNSGVYVRGEDKHYPDEEGLDEENIIWEIEPYYFDPITKLTLPSLEVWQYKLFIEELKSMK